jgi:hypothetical protein
MAKKKSRKRTTPGTAHRKPVVFKPKVVDVKLPPDGVVIVKLPQNVMPVVSAHPTKRGVVIAPARKETWFEWMFGRGY